MHRTQVEAFPSGPLEEKWDKHRFEMKLVNPANKRKYTVIVVGSGLAGGAAAASLSELGYNVKCFCFQDSPRRAHSIAAQGGINAAKNYQNDGDSVYRLFYDTIKGGDFRAREANVYRLAQVSVNIIDQCVAQGVPFAREYGGLLANRSFGGAQVSRTFYARGQTGQQLLLGAYQALEKEIAQGRRDDVSRAPRCSISSSSTDARAASSTRDMVTGEIETHLADAVVLGTGGYGNVFYLSTNAKGSQRHGDLARVQARRGVRESVLHADPPDVHSGERRAPVEAHADERVAAQRRPRLGAEAQGRLRRSRRARSPRPSATTTSSGSIRASATSRRATSRRAPRRKCATKDAASAPAAAACTSTSPTRSGGSARTRSRERYGNLFEMYERITDENPYEVPMRIYPAVHYTMGGLWVDYNLMSTIPGLHVIGEANFSDHGANRLGASALMQGLADGYFVAAADDRRLPRLDQARAGRAPTIPTVRATRSRGARADREAARGQGQAHRRLVPPRARQDRCGRTAAWRAAPKGSTTALEIIPELRDEFWRDVAIPGTGAELNQSLEKAGRVADFLELAELMCLDALHREESCGGHFRVEHQTPDGEALRDDEQFAYVAAWEYAGDGKAPVLNKEPLVFENVALSQRSYK